MLVRVVGFQLDEEGEWKVVLSCGHVRHVGHRPPFERREWVVSEEGRRGMVGREVECLKCDEEASEES